MTAPINPHVHTHSRHVAADSSATDIERTSRDGSGAVDADDGAQNGSSAAVSVDVRSAVGAENQAAAQSVPEHLDAAAQLLSSLSAQMAENPNSARAAHANLSGQAALSLLA